MKAFEIDDNYCKEAADAYFAEEEEMKLGIHPTQVVERIKDWFSKNGNDTVDVAKLDEWSGSTVKVYIKYSGSSDGKFFGVFNYINNEFDSIEDPIRKRVDELITENDEARIGIDLWFSEHEIDKDFYIEETTPESNLVKVYVDDEDEYGEFSKFFGIFDTDKCDFVDNQMGISENMEFFDIKDNPFDIMMYAALELTRSVMFAARRHRNSGVAESLWKSDEDVIDRFVEMIHHQYSILNSVNQETIDFLRTHSYMGGIDYHKDFSDNNKYILSMEKKLDTIYSHTVPCRDLEYEKVRLENDPATMMRLLSRQNLADKCGLTKARLYHLLDVLECPEGIITTSSEEEESVKQDKKFIEENRLTSDDIEYMISYVEKKERK